jgi:hypothetical protein
MKNRIVINGCFGGFGLSVEAINRLIQLGSPYARIRTPEEIADFPVGGPVYLDSSIPRHDPLLVQVVEELKGKADGAYAELLVEEIEGDKYVIRNYDGQESVVTPADQPEWVVIE